MCLCECKSVSLYKTGHYPNVFGLIACLFTFAPSQSPAREGNFSILFLAVCPESRTVSLSLKNEESAYYEKGITEKL